MRSRVGLVIVGMMAAVLLICSEVHSVAYVRIGGIDGDTRDIAHKHWIELLSFSQGPYHWTQKEQIPAFLPKNSMAEGKGAITMTRHARQSLPEIYTACVNSTYFSTVTLNIPMGEKRFVKLHLNDTVISELDLRQSESKTGFPLEQITMNFESARWEVPNIAPNQSYQE